MKEQDIANVIKGKFEYVKLEEKLVNPTLIFLDIDGVLNSTTYFMSRKFKNMMKGIPKEQTQENRSKFHVAHLDKERVGSLNTLCKLTKAKVVISSTWRLRDNIETLVEELRTAGATFEVIGVTPAMRTERGVEIKQWIIDNVEKSHSYGNYIILDDDADMLLEQQYNFFQTDYFIGLTPTIVYRAEKFLNKFTQKSGA